MNFREFFEAQWLIEQAGSQITLPSGTDHVDPRRFNLPSGVISMITLPNGEPQKSNVKFIPVGQYSVEQNSPANYILTPLQPKHQDEVYYVTWREYQGILKIIQSMQPTPQKPQGFLGRMFGRRKVA